MSFWWGAGTGLDYNLTIDGVGFIKHIPLDVSPIRWTLSGPGVTGSASFTVESATGREGYLSGGSRVRIRDNVNEKVLFGGVLLEANTRRGVASMSWTDCEAAAWDYFLDNIIVPRWSSRVNAGNRVRKIASDRNMVLDLIERRGGVLRASYATVDATNTDMDVVTISGETLRSALEAIADEAQEGSTTGRHFYVDPDRWLHWYETTEGLAAPYRIGDGSYVRSVIDRASLAAYWSLRERDGSYFYAHDGSANLSRPDVAEAVGDPPVPNEPSYHARRWTDTDRAATTDVAGLKAGDSFTFETWIRMRNFGADGILMTTTGDADTGPAVHVLTDGNVRLYKRSTAADFLTTTAPLYDAQWHHLMVSHDIGSTLVIVDGVSQDGTATAQTFTDAWTTWQLGALSGAVNADSRARRLVHGRARHGHRHDALPAGAHRRPV